jgi:HAE1 family hydrophobic/amphiphilic exporter-1
MDSYLKKLQFDPALLNGFMARVLGAPRILFLALFTLIIAGVYSFNTLPRELNPEIEIPIITVTTVLPGANPLDVEELITNKLEKEIDSIVEIDKISSSSLEGVSSIVVTFVTSADPDKALTQVKEKVDLVTDLPNDATTPRVAKIDFNDQPVLQVALVGNVDRRSLARVAETVQNELESLSSVRSVSVLGGETEQIVIKINPELLQTYGLSAGQIAQAISSNNITVPVGTLQVNETEYQVSVDSTLTTIEDLRSIPILVTGQTVLLGDVAQVYFQAEKTNSFTNYVTADTTKNAVQLSVFKTRSATIIDAAEQANQTIDKVLEAYPQVEVVTIYDFGVEIDKQFVDLAFNFRDTIGLVFITLFLFIGLRQAVIASLAIPLTFLATFVIMQLIGISLNFLSLFSLLLALGLVVDSAIVIVEASYRYGKKFTPLQTGLLVFRDFVVPLLTSTLTTVWAFLPLLLATGIIGEFIKSIPVVVSATLLSSVVIALFVNLPLVVIFSELQVPKRVKYFLLGLVVIASIFVLLSIVSGSPMAGLVIIAWLVVLAVLGWTRVLWWQKLKNQPQLLTSVRKIRAVFNKRKYAVPNVLEAGIINLSPVTNKYRKILTKILISKKGRIAVYAASSLLFITSIVFLATGLLKNEFFPKTDQLQLYVNIEGPSGWPLEKTQAVLEKVQEIVLQVPEIKHIVTQTNTLAGGELSSGQSGPHLAGITIVLKDLADRDRTSMAISESLRKEFEQIVEANVSVVEQIAGPPVGADLDISIIGRDLAQLEKVANDFMALISEIQGAVNIDTSLKQNAGQIKVRFIPVELQQRGLSAGQVAVWLRTAVTGSTAGEITIGQNDLEIIVTAEDEELTLSRLQNLVIPYGQSSYALAEVARFELETSPTVVDHLNMDRVVRVTASAENISVPDLLKEFEQKVAEYELPVGVTWTVGGANQENQESTNSIIQAMGLSVILILVTMVLQLNSFRKSLLVLVVIPLAVAGVFINFTILGIPLSFAALIGVLGLFGIVVNNSIMLLEKINQNIKFGLPFVDAIASACSSRVEAIFFTSLTTAMGLLPITISDPFWRGLGGAIIAGLSVSGIFILFLLPALYYEMYQGSDENKSILKNKYSFKNNKNKSTQK